MRARSLRRVGGHASDALVILTTAAVLLLTSSGGADAGDDAEWSQIAPLAPRSLLLGASRAGQRVVAVGERGHVLLSDDRGVSWRQVSVPTRSTLTAVHFASPEIGVAVGHDAVVLSSADGGETWERRHWDPDLESPLLDVWLGEDGRGFAVGAYGLFLETTDAGKSWRSRTIGDGDVHHNAITSTASGALFVVGERGSAFRSEDAGESWSALELPDPASLFGAFGLPGGELIAFGLQGRAYLTRDEGESWQHLDSQTEASIMGGAVTERGLVVLGGIGGVLLVGSPGDGTLELLQRPDRKALSAAVALPGQGVLLLGAFGVADASDSLPALHLAASPIPRTRSASGGR